MSKAAMALLALALVGGCNTYEGTAKEDNNMKTLTIQWQRLVDEKGQTCQRCAATEAEIQKAFRSLRQSLAPLGIEVVLEKKALDTEICSKDISQSNRIWVGEQALEKWLGAKVGKSPCATCCPEPGNNVECRTMQIGAETYEAIPAELIIKAGLLAASQLFPVAPSQPCCESKDSKK